MHLGILTSHPIQYQAPWFRGLAKEVELEVFFADRPDANQQGSGFGRAFSWDVDLLSGYSHRFLKNVSSRPSPNRFLGCDTPEIKSVIRNARFDAFIVSGWYLKSYWQAVRACRLARIPVLVRGDSQLLTPRSSLKRWLKYGVYRLVLRQFDGFLVVGQRNREYLAHYGVPTEKMYLAPHFVDNEWFAGKAEEVRGQRSEIRSRWGIPEGAFCVLFCGKFISKKRPLDLVKAAKLLKESGRQPNIHLLFVGSGELGMELRRSCNIIFDAEYPDSRLPTPDSQLPSASFAGFQNQSKLPAAYVAADVLVLPSESETWGLAVNEAMACSLPAIVSNAVGCAPDMVEEGKTGFTFPVGDVDALGSRLAETFRRVREGHSFGDALRRKLPSYSVGVAVSGTIYAVKSAAMPRPQVGGRA